MAVVRTLKIVGGWAAAIAVVLGMSYMAERPKYHFEEVAKHVGQQLPGGRLIQSAKSGDLTSPVSWFWPATTTFNYAVPDLGKGRFYLVSLSYGDTQATVRLLDADCEARNVDQYDLDEPQSASPARDWKGDPVLAPNGKTFRLYKYHLAVPAEWMHAFCDTDWTTERKAVFNAQRASGN